jgi:hypothetical protein
MPTKSSFATIKKLRYLCSRHGIPKILVTDNGTQFSSAEFGNFTKENGITHFFSAPYNPMSNGQAERFVDTFKRTFQKLKGEGAPGMEIIETFLVTYRTTPNNSLPDGKSPSEIFLGRKPRTTLDLLRPPQIQPIERDQEMERNFNRRFGTKLRTFDLGNHVFARHRISQSWKAGTIVKITGVIYDVRLVDGSIARFHTNQLRSRHTPNVAEDPLAIFNETFNLPMPPRAQELNLENGVPHGQGNEGNAEANMEVAPKRNPPRNRVPPKRFTPRP